MSNVVVITGGTLGIGRELVKQFYEAGFNVATVARNLVDIETLRKEYPDPLHFFAIPLSVSNTEGVRNFLTQVEERFGSITHLINNAGVTGPLAKAGAIPPESALETVSTNFFGTINLTSQMLERMNHSGTKGTIINISSGSSSGVPGLSVYSASKVAVNSYSSIAAKEYSETGIRIFSVNPGHVETRLQKAARAASPLMFPSALQFRKFYQENGVISPERSATAIFFLANNSSRFESGSYLSYKDIEIQSRAIKPPVFIFSPQEVSAARRDAITRMGPEAISGEIWKRFPLIKIDDVTLRSPNDLEELEGRVLKQIHDTIGASERPIVCLQFGDQFFPIYKNPVGVGMAGVVYEIADSNKVIKISKPMPLAIAFMLREKERAPTIEGLMQTEHFFTPKNYHFDDYGIYGVKERLKGMTLTKLFLDNAVIELKEDSDGKTIAELSNLDLLETRLEISLLTSLQKEIVDLMDLRAKHPQIINDLGPDNLIPLFNPDRTELIGLSLVDIGPHTELTKKRFDEAHLEGFSGYLEIATKLVNRYLNTGVLTLEIGAATGKANLPVSSDSRPFRTFRPLEEAYLAREALNDYLVVSAIHSKYRPGAGTFKVKYLEILRSEIEVIDSGLGPHSLRKMVFPENSPNHIRFPIHPESEHLYQPLIEKYGIAGEYEAGATSSTRSVLAVDDDGVTSGQLKLSLAKYQSKRGRVVPAWEVRRSIAISRLASLTPEETWIKSGASIIPEVAGAHIRSEWKLGSYVDVKQGVVFEHGFILRDISFLRRFPKTEVYPLFSLFAEAEGSAYFVIELWRKSGENDFYTFINNFLFKPFLEKNSYLMFKEGIIPEIHSQNLLVAINPETRTIEHFFHRDVGSMKIDLRMRWIHNLPISPLRSEDPACDFKFKRASEVVEEDFMRYFHDETFVRGYLPMLQKYVPGFNPEITRSKLKSELYTSINQALPVAKKVPEGDGWVQKHLEAYYEEHIPATPHLRVANSEKLNSFIEGQKEKRQIMELPKTWAKSFNIAVDEQAPTPYGILFRDSENRLHVAYYNSEPIEELVALPSGYSFRILTSQ